MTVTPVISSVCCLCVCLRARAISPPLLFQLHGRFYLAASSASARPGAAGHGTRTNRSIFQRNVGGFGRRFARPLSVTTCSHAR